MTEISFDELRAEIEAAWERRDELSVATKGPVRTAVDETVARLDAGKLRAAERVDGVWKTHQWIKQAILLSFRLNPNQVLGAGALGGGGGPWWDKIPSKFDGWDAPHVDHVTDDLVGFLERLGRSR